MAGRKGGECVRWGPSPQRTQRAQGPRGGGGVRISTSSESSVVQLPGQSRGWPRAMRVTPRQGGAASTGPCHRGPRRPHEEFRFHPEP